MYWSGVVVTEPSVLTVAVHSNENGSPSGLEYRIVTSPVAASFDSEKSHATCSLAAERLDLFLYGLSWAWAACVAFWNSRA